MAVIVAFGDSNTWGYDPATATRFPPDVRWTGVMRRELGAGHSVIEEGLNGRTTVFDDPIEPDRRGADYLPPCLRSHAPLDVLIIALGCNDMKARFGVPPADIAAGAERLILMARAEPVGPNGAPPKVILVAPPPRRQADALSPKCSGARRRNRDIWRRATARSPSARASDSSTRAQFIACSDLDGIHFEADQHAVLGHAMAEAVRIMVG